MRRHTSFIRHGDLAIDVHPYCNLLSYMFNPAAMGGLQTYYCVSVYCGMLEHRILPPSSGYNSTVKMDTAGFYRTSLLRRPIVISMQD
jgi:hypothetical protein